MDDLADTAILDLERDLIMREESLGPVRNPDGSPSDITKAMLAGTGRSPEAFVARKPITSRVVDESLLRADHSPSGGTSFERYETETLVTGTDDPEAAKREADWRVRQTVEGQIEHVTFERIEGPDWAGNYIVTHVVDTTREW